MENTGSSKNAEMCILKHQKARKMHWDGHKMTLKRDIRDEAQKRRNTTECDRKRRVSHLYLERYRWLCGRQKKFFGMPHKRAERA